jgi:hypothetical protein
MLEMTLLLLLVCRDEVAKTNGTIQPLGENIGPKRKCLFTIQTSSSDQQIQISCSTIKLKDSTLSVISPLYFLLFTLFYIQ